MRKIGCSTYHVSSYDVTDDLPRIAVKYFKKKGSDDATLGLDVKHYLYEGSVIKQIRPVNYPRETLSCYVKFTKENNDEMLLKIKVTTKE
jgi:hypothetical protein